jgi:hypothetical protein
VFPMELSTNPLSKSRGNMPLYVKIIILVQAAVILSFTVGMYQDYLNNSYLQEYAVRVFTSSLVADAMLSMVTISMFAIGTFTLLGSMSSTKRLSKQWRLPPEEKTRRLSMPLVPVPDMLDRAPVAKRRTNRRRESTTSRTRQRRPRVDKEHLYQSMVNYAETHRD